MEPNVDHCSKHGLAFTARNQLATREEAIERAQSFHLMVMLVLSLLVSRENLVQNELWQIYLNMANLISPNYECMKDQEA